MNRLITTLLAIAIAVPCLFMDAPAKAAVVYSGSGNTLTLTAPVAGVTNKVPVVIESILCLPQSTATSGNKFACVMGGVWTGVTKKAGASISPSSTKSG